MAKKKKTRRDVAEIARENLEQIIGEKLTGEPLDEPEEADDISPAAPSKSGASEGGKARAKKLSKKRRSEIAKNAAHKRWGYDSDESGSSSGQ